MTTRARRRKRKVRRYVVLVLLVSLGVSGYMLTRSRLFGISEIAVVGTVQRDAIIAASGLHVGQSVMGLDMDLVAGRIERLPLVADARVTRDGALKIRIVIVERHPALEVRSGTERWFIAQDGQMIEAEPKEGLPVLELPEGQTPEGEATAAVLELWRALPSQLRARATSFGMNDAATLEVSIDDIRVVFGRADQIRAKVRALKLVLSRFAASGQTVRRIDLRSPSHPAVRAR